MEAEGDSLARAGLHVHGRHFLDSQNRVVQMRGANVSGCSKVPSSDPNVDIENPHLASYVNRPFPLSEAPIHWRRLKRWGLHYLRITVTWEAIEHAGPGQYDEDYLTYLRRLLESMTEYGLVCYVALHQDIWSRISGGSGAPAWTLSYANISLSPSILGETSSAWLHGVSSSTRYRSKTNTMKNGLDGELEWEHSIDESVKGERGLWPTGYQKLACATMNTLFWAGKTFAPNLMVEDPTDQNRPKNIQAFLQERYLGMFEKLMEALEGIPGVLGYEIINEPHPGYIGMQSLYGFNYDTDLHLGDYPSPLQSFALGAGHAQEVPHYERSWPFPSKITGFKTLNTQGITVWETQEGVAEKKKEQNCLWAQHGVWGYDDHTNKPVVLKEGYFTKDGQGKDVNFYDDFYWPFVKRWEELISQGTGGKGMVHVEGVPNEFCPEWPKDVRPQERLVFSPHWYDLNALFNKSFGFMTVNVQGLSRGMFIGKAIYFGRKAARDNYSVQIGNIVNAARVKLGEVPIVIGETGVPMDINNKAAFKDGDFCWQSRMVDSILAAVEKHMIGVNLWTYNPRNTDENGDEWNFENFSWFSEDKRQELLWARFLESDLPEKGAQAKTCDDDDLDLGARMLEEIVRPYPLRTAGIPLSIEYDPQTTVFRFRFANPVHTSQHNARSEAPPLTNHPAIKSTETEIFLPPRFLQAWKGKTKHPLTIKTSDGSWKLQETRQVLIWTHDNQQEGFVHEFSMRIKPEPVWWQQSEILIKYAVTLLVAILAILLGMRLQA